eukprot:TRINITY_DN632_c0_g1_i1.p1 TRINITY_DN632_c0_g1~~TRINITY_DN632_c0_g1_i1.p1  ORF type:complete len:134 (-),score=27.76 TRINITY_DN632_c0_g1_i1:173-574(-)
MLDKAEGEISNAIDSIAQLKLVMQMTPSTQRSPMRIELEKLQHKLTTAQEAHARTQLLPTATAADVAVSIETRLARSGESIKRSSQLANETVEVGRAVLTQLGLDRERIVGAIDKVHAIDDNISRARGILRKF